MKLIAVNIDEDTLNSLSLDESNSPETTNPADIRDENNYANVQKTKSEQKRSDVSITNYTKELSASNQISDVENDHAQNLAEFIDDTGIRAVALYDYEAAADDEISFDPDDVITHIEQVSFDFYENVNEKFN